MNGRARSQVWWPWDAQWTTVVLPHGREPRFRRICYSCGAAPCASVARFRVPSLDQAEEAADADTLSPIDVPVCDGCRARRGLRVVVVVAFFAVLLVVFLARDRPNVRPASADWPWFTRILVVAAFAAAFVLLILMVASAFASRIDVVAHPNGVRWSFRKHELAAAFAADNGVTIEGGPPPEPTRDEHDPDGVDHTGKHADPPDADD